MTWLPLVAGAAMAAPFPYGPVTVEWNVQLPGNPYDFAVNDVRARFVSSDGAEEMRLAYWDEGVWKAVLRAPSGGSWKATLLRSGKEVGETQQVELVPSADSGFVRRTADNRFQLDDGRPYWPLGFNIGWYSGPIMPAIPDMVHKAADAGVNWTRVWACHWDGKNPWWTMDDPKPEVGELSPRVLAQWDAIIRACSDRGVRMQMVMFHHGQWTTRVNPNWNENPWNKANGGFLERPADFFTDRQAKHLAKIWLRYAVARWGHEPGIMAWELFNEVEWVDAFNDGRAEDVAAWHREMTAYLRDLDPYKRLVTTSSDVKLPIYDAADYYQPHGYPPSVAAMVFATQAPSGDRPLFYGEVGPGEFTGAKPVQQLAVRDGIWSAAIAGHAGAGQYWTWDFVARDDLYRDFDRASKLLAEYRLTETPLRRTAVNSGAGRGGDLVVRPGGGWDTEQEYAFHLPSDVPGKMGKFSPYFQGRAHPELRKQPIQFRFHAEQPGEFRVRLVGAAEGGGALSIAISQSVLNHEYPAETSWAEGQEVRASFAPGDVEVTLDNQGPDWVRIDSITVTGIGERVTAVAGVGDDRVLMRLQRGAQSAAPIQIAPELDIPDGAYEGVLADLDSAAQPRVRVQVKRGKMSPLTLRYRDAVLILRRRSAAR